MQQSKQPCQVYVNVYELPKARCKTLLSVVRMGIYHTAIQIGKQEFTYGGNQHSDVSGIYMNAPRKNSQFKFLFSIPVYFKRDPERSVLTMTEFEIFNVLIPRMSRRYQASSYDILKFNCNHFTDEFL